MNKIQLQKMFEEEVFSKEKILEVTSLEELTATLDNSDSHLDYDSIDETVQACFSESHEKSYSPVFEDAVKKTGFLLYILKIDKIIYHSIVRILDSSSTKFAIWFDNFIENSGEQTQKCYQYYLKMYDKYSEYKFSFHEISKEINDMSEILESKNILDEFVNKIAAYTK